MNSAPLTPALSLSDGEREKPIAIEMRGVGASSQKDPSAIVVEDVNWSVAQGDYWVVGAPQYSGKSDFLMMAGGLTSPCAGHYKLFGEAMPIFDEHRLAHRLKLGFVFDGGQLLSGLSVAENIALPLQYHQEFEPEELEARVAELLELTDLTALANHASGRIGRSWQQRVGLARALALQPEVLLVDSPLTGLDVRHANWWLGFLGELSRGPRWLDGRPVTIVVTADDFRPWRGHAKQFACLSEKRFHVVGEWPAVEQSRDSSVLDLLDTGSSRD